MPGMFVHVGVYKQGQDRVGAAAMHEWAYTSLLTLLLTLCVLASRDSTRRPRAKRTGP